MIDLFEELAAVSGALEKAEIPHALVGGLAFSVWVEARTTEDIDLLIRPEDWERIPGLLKPLGFQSFAPPMNFKTVRIRRLTKLSGSDALVLDFLLADGERAEGLSKSVRVSHGGREFPVAPPEVIIELKRGRMSAKDKSDIEGLERVIERRKDD